MKITALVAAAGDSQRMGTPKALLPLGAVTFVEHLAKIFANACQVVVTIPNSDAVAKAIKKLVGPLGVRCVPNLYPALGLTGSIASALELVSCDGLFVCPVDMPFVTRELIEALMQRHHKGPLIALPVAGSENQMGHPAFFSDHFFEALCNSGDGPKAVIVSNRKHVREVPWDDSRILCNINTPEDYERAMGAG